MRVALIFQKGPNSKYKDPKKGLTCFSKNQVDLIPGQKKGAVYIHARDLRKRCWLFSRACLAMLTVVTHLGLGTMLVLEFRVLGTKRAHHVLICAMKNVIATEKHSLVCSAS